MEKNMSRWVVTTTVSMEPVENGTLFILIGIHQLRDCFVFGARCLAYRLIASNERLSFAKWKDVNSNEPIDRKYVNSRFLFPYTADD